MAVSFGFRAGSLALGSGGGDMPAGLQSDMDAVLNKKFDTSTTYPPEGWPDNVNLLGPLPEKTVSGSVASCSDGADDVPTKSLVVTIPPTLDGVSQVVETQAGKNLFNEDWEIGGINDTTGVPNSDTNKIRSKTFSQIKGGTTCYVGAPQNIRVLFYTSSETFISETANIKNASFSVPSNCALFKIRGTVDYGTTYNNDIIICYGSTARNYEPYITPIVYTANLGRTIYGGTADIVNGVGSDNCTRIKVSDLTWTYYTAGTNPIFYAQYVSNMKTYARGEVPNIAIDGYTTKFAQSRSYLATNLANLECSAIENYATIAFRNDSYTSVSAMLADLGDEYIVYEVATPTDFTFDGQEINTMLGYNAFWSDEGDSEVTYRSSSTITPVVPVLTTKTITENGTYSAEDDHCDGYSQVTVQAPAGHTFPSTLNFTEIATDANSSGTLTFTDDYHNYALLKVRMYNPNNQATEEVICTPRFIDDAFQYSDNKANFNFVGTDKYAYYGAGQNNTWVRGGYRDICVSAVFGVTSSTHNIITTTIHRYQSINSGNNEIFFLESTYDYDYFAISICDGDSTETQPSFQLVTAGKGGFNEFSKRVLVSGYNSLRNFIIQEHKMADASGNRFGFFTVEGITFEEITT